MEVLRNTKIDKIKTHGKYKILKSNSDEIKVQKIAFCNAAGVSKFAEVDLKTSYAPISVVSGVPKNYKSFVELDYFPKNCINLLNKGSGIGLAGGISFKDKSKADNYLDTVLKKHQKLVSSIKEIDRYTGIKTEVTFKNQPRGYIYNIANISNNIWALIPGKFTLAFSMALSFIEGFTKKIQVKILKPII